MELLSAASRCAITSKRSIIPMLSCGCEASPPQEAPVSEGVVCEMHRRIVARSEPGLAGVYSRLPRRIAGSTAAFPNPGKIPALMQAFAAWLEAAPNGPATAFEAHLRLTAIHPFGDGNGRTARLLMNFLLIRQGYPPVAVRPEDRKAYLDAMERASLTGDLLPFQALMHERLLVTLEEYLAVLSEALPEESKSGDAGVEGQHPGGS
jgi:Fic family protein